MALRKIEKLEPNEFSITRTTGEMEELKIEGLEKESKEIDKLLKEKPSKKYNGKGESEEVQEFIKSMKKKKIPKKKRLNIKSKKKIKKLSKEIKKIRDIMK